MKTLSIILSSLSTLAVVFAIIFEGRFKKRNKKEVSITAFKSEILKLSFLGWFLIGISILMNLGNGYLAIKNIDDNNKKYIEDTTRISNLLKAASDANKQFKLKSISDSIEILGFKKVANDIGLKSDSIKLAIVDNAVKAMDEQRKAIEKEKENIFIHMHNEVKDNLQKILVNYEKKSIIGFEDTPYFMSTRLNNFYIKKYESISNQRYVIGYLTEAAEAIDFVNNYADMASSSPAKSNEKKLNIRMFLKNVEAAQDYLYSIYNRVVKLQSYKEYESIDFSDSIPPINRDALNNYLLLDYIYRPAVKKALKIK